jgi:hypothetical protein
MPIPETAFRALEQWKIETRFSKPKGWVFASEQTDGKQPQWFNSLLARHVRQAALGLALASVRAGTRSEGLSQHCFTRGRKVM